MPHLIVEFSSNLSAVTSVDDLINDLHQATIDDGIAPLAGIRTRAAERSTYQIADRDPRNAFVAIIARVGPGRTDEVKVRYITCLLDTAEASLAHVGDQLSIAFSAEIQEIDAPMRINRNHIRTRLEAERAAESPSVAPTEEATHG